MGTITDIQGWVSEKSSLISSFGMPFQEIEVAEINQYTESLTHNKDRVLFIDGIGQQRHTTCNAKPPEG